MKRLKISSFMCVLAAGLALLLPGAVGYYYILNNNPETGSTAQTLIESYS